MLKLDRVNQNRKSNLKVPAKHRIRVKSQKERKIFSVRFSFSQGLDFIKEISLDLDNISKGIDDICKTPAATKPERVHASNYKTMQLPVTPRHSRKIGPRIVKIHTRKRS